MFVSTRNEAAAEHTAESIRQRGRGTGEAFACDLASPDSVCAFAAALADRTDHLDVLVNNGAGYLHGENVDDVEDNDIITTIGGTATGTGRGLCAVHGEPTTGLLHS